MKTIKILEFLGFRSKKQNIVRPTNMTINHVDYNVVKIMSRVKTHNENNQQAISKGTHDICEIVKNYIEVEVNSDNYPEIEYNFSILVSKRKN